MTVSVGTRGGAVRCVVKLDSEDILKDAEAIKSHVKEKKGIIRCDI